MYNRDVLGTRQNPVERKLSASTVAGIRLQWSFPTAGNVNATPVVIGAQVYAGDTSGTFYALLEDSNSPAKVRQLWATKVQAPITASALVMGKRVIFGDQAGFVYGLDRETGAILWSVRPNPHPLAAIYSSAIPVGGDVVLGISSNEENAAETPGSGYPCCSFRGSVARINASTGNIVWQSFLISEAEQRNGSAGAAVWSTPAYDAATKLVYVTTSDNYSPPATATGEAIVALEGRTGRMRWIRTFRVGNGVVPDADFGDSPQVYVLPGGRKVVSAGQKSGTFHVVDAATGAVVNEYAASPLCGLGIESLGLFADSALAEGIVFANGTDCSFGGQLFALKGDGSGELWRYSTGPASPALSGVAVANGVVYFQVFSVSASGPTGTLHALEMHTGRVLASLPLNTAAISGPAVSNGRVYIGTGVTFPPFVETQGGSILAFGHRPGDVNGDSVIDCKDLQIVRNAFGRKMDQPGFDSRADAVTDGIVDVRDLAFVSQRLPVGTRCN